MPTAPQTLEIPFPPPTNIGSMLRMFPLCGYPYYGDILIMGIEISLLLRYPSYIEISLSWEYSANRDILIIRTSLLKGYP